MAALIVVLVWWCWWAMLKGSYEKEID
jgi:hypothetical protein